MGALVFATIQIFVIGFGFAVTAVSTSVAIKRKSRSALYFGVFAAGSTLLLVSAVMSWVYETDAGLVMLEAPLAPRLLHALVLATGVLFIVTASTRFSHSVSGIRTTGIFSVMQWIEFVCCLTGLLVNFLVPPMTPVVNFFLLFLVIATLTHSTLFLIVNGSPGFEKSSYRLLVYALMVFVLFVLIYGTVFIINHGIPGKIAAYVFDVFFIVEMTFMLIITQKSFDHPLFLQDGKVSDYFLTLYSLSGRESDIINKLIGDMDNKTIAYELGLSVRTVENHLYAIYKKTGSSSRIKLVRLLNSSGDPVLR